MMREGHLGAGGEFLVGIDPVDPDIGGLGEVAEHPPELDALRRRLHLAGPCQCRFNPRKRCWREIQGEW
jgi:hypothetical protein